MKLLPLTLLLAFQATAVQAAPIVFTSTNYTTSALAGVDIKLNGPNNDSAPSSSLPLNSVANVNTSDGSASAASAANGLSLSVATAATGSNLVADASAVTTFTGNFSAIPGTLSLLLNFASIGGGAQLFVTLDVGGVTLFDDSFIVTQLVNASMLLSPALAGASGILDITLSSLADVAVAENEANTASVAFALNVGNAVPEPTIMVDLLLGLGLMAILCRRSGRCAVR